MNYQWNLAWGQAFAHFLDVSKCVCYFWCMMTAKDLVASVERIEKRLDTIDDKLDQFIASRRKSLQWIETMSQHVQSLDMFREEVRGSLEPLFSKLQNLDDLIRIMRHATADVSRRVEEMETEQKIAV